MARVTLTLFFTCILLTGQAALAEPTINVGTFTLLPNTANQTITIPVIGGDSVTGFNLRSQIGDGTGPEVEPIFQSVDFGTGTIWAGHSSTSLGGPVTGALSDAQASVVLNNTGDSVQALGGLVNFTISTVGVAPGSYPLLLSGTEIGLPSVFIGSQGVDIPALINNGTINVTPEPGALCLISLSGAGILLRRRRNA